MSLAVDRKKDEMVITKHTASIFIVTDFDEVYRIAGNDNYRSCFQSSAIDALYRNFISSYFYI